MTAKKGKVPEYTKKAQANYMKKFRSKSVRVPLKLHDLLVEKYGNDFSFNAFCINKMLEDLGLEKEDVM